MQAPDRSGPQRATHPRPRRKRAGRETSERWLRCRLDEYQAQRLRREAAGTDQTIASLARGIFEEHWALQDELASAIGRVGDEKCGRIIHHLLAETEERIAASYETELRLVRRQLSTVLERLQLLATMVAEAYRGFLLHTAEVALDHQEAFQTSASDRYLGYEESVRQILARGGLELANKLEKEGDTG